MGNCNQILNIENINESSEEADTYGGTIWHSPWSVTENGMRENLWCICMTACMIACMIACMLACVCMLACICMPAFLHACMPA